VAAVADDAVDGLQAQVEGGIVPWAAAGPGLAGVLRSGLGGEVEPVADNDIGKPAVVFPEALGFPKQRAEIRDHGRL